MPAQAGVASPTEHLFGDWWGASTYLESQGIYLSFDALNEFAGNVSGGVKQGSAFANQEAFGAGIDWQRLAGIPGLSARVIIVNRSGGNDSNLFGDHLLPVQKSTVREATWRCTSFLPMSRRICSTVRSTLPQDA